nr:MAG TPA: hypothetical protein [Caudoviricetes sp.]
MWTESMNYLRRKPIAKYKLTVYLIYTSTNGRGKTIYNAMLSGIKNYTNLPAMCMKNAIDLLKEKGEIVLSISIVSKDEYDATNS